IQGLGGKRMNGRPSAQSKRIRLQNPMMTMTIPGLQFFPALAAALLPALFSVCAAGHLSVRDEAGFFSAQAKQEATRTINDLAATLRKDVVVETFQEVP